MEENYILAAQNLLYHRPLYEYIGSSESGMNVLVLGWSDFSEAFVDQCLQAGQMDKHRLNIEVRTSEAAVKMAEYLSARPAIKDFVNVNGSLTGTAIEPYAVLNFRELNESGIDENALVDIISEAPDEKYHYFLVSFENENRNRKISQILREVVDVIIPTEKCVLHCVTHNSLESPEGVIAVCSKGLEKATDIDPELERMAYNAHMIWSDSINGDAKKELERFRADRYNYQSSVALALSIKYKLADLGICTTDKHSAAQQFWNLVQSGEHSETINRVIALEHRRWVLDRVCQGWTAPKSEERLKFYDSCAEMQSNRDNIRHIHPCIVRSRADAPLSEGDFAVSRAAWDVKNAEREKNLDDLDRMSLELHRRLLTHANAYRKSNPMEKGEMDEIRQKLYSCGCVDSVIREWERFAFCVKNILDGNVAFSKKYKQYREQFAAKLFLEPHDRLYVEQRLDQIDRKIWCVTESNLYRDYKKNDEILVKKIPFILTYSIHLSMAAGFRVTSTLNMLNDSLFANVASATVIKPENITYLLRLDDHARPELVSRTIRKVYQYMLGKGIQCRLDFLITGLRQKQESRYGQWRRCFDLLKADGCIFDYKIQLTEKDQASVRFWADELSRRQIDIFDGTANLFQSMQANGIFLESIKNRYPYFEFDRKSKGFRHNEDCRFLSYIEDRTYLGIEEMFGLAGAEDMEYHYPVLGNEYRKLWAIYTGQNRGNPAYRKNNIRNCIKNWNTLCDLLEDFDIRHPNSEHVSLPELKNIFQISERWRNVQYRWNDILNILKELSGELGGKQYLIPEKVEGEMTGFRYSHPDIKQVLTKAGEILEICAYFAICETGLFDEVACGYRFHWEGDRVNNELDLVLTRGFQSVIVEAKARTRLDQDMFFKLSSLADMFGIGTHKVLLTTADAEYGDNEMQMERGNMMGITTISDIDEIQNLTETLINLL